MTTWKGQQPVQTKYPSTRGTKSSSPNSS